MPLGLVPSNWSPRVLDPRGAGVPYGLGRGRSRESVSAGCRGVINGFGEHGLLAGRVTLLASIGGRIVKIECQSLRRSLSLYRAYT